MAKLFFFLQEPLPRRQPLGGSCDAGTFERGSGHDCFSFIFVSDVFETRVFESGLSLRKRLTRRTLVSASATTPPLELTLTANAAALTMQTGHMVCFSFAPRINACGPLRRA